MELVLLVPVMGVVFAAIFVFDHSRPAPPPSAGRRPGEPDHRLEPDRDRYLEREQQLVYSWQHLESEGMIRCAGWDTEISRLVAVRRAPS